MKLRPILLIVILATWCRANAAGVPASAISSNAPAAPSLGYLPRLKSVSQYGITWTFEQPVPVGHFVNGDFYVAGAVTITNIEPRTLRGAEVPATEVVE